MIRLFQSLVFSEMRKTELGTLEACLNLS
jgi:hypothetical protein